MAPLPETIWKRYENVSVWTWPKYFVWEPCPLMTDWILRGKLSIVLAIVAMSTSSQQRKTRSLNCWNDSCSRIFSNVLSNTRLSLALSLERGPGFLFVTPSSFLPLCPSRSDMFLFQVQWADDFDMPHVLAISLKLPSRSFPSKTKGMGLLKCT